MNTERFKARKRAETIKALETLLSGVKRGIFVPYSVSVWQSQTDKRCFWQFAVIDDDYEQDFSKIALDLNNL
jgi:hypothetical protein